MLPIAVVDGADEAIARANASRYGLTASLWTKNKTKARILAHKLRAGVVTINNHGSRARIPAAPWSGHGETGWGITGSTARPRHADATALRAASTRAASKRELWWYPYTPALREVALAMATLRCGTAGLFARVGALFRLVGAMLERMRGG